MKILQKALLTFVLVALPVWSHAANELGQTNKFLTNSADDVLNMDMNNDVLTRKPDNVSDATWEKINQYIIDYEGYDSLFQETLNKAKAERKEKGFVNQDLLEKLVMEAVASAKAVQAFGEALMKYNLKIKNTSLAMQRSRDLMQLGYGAYVTWGEDFYNFVNLTTQFDVAVAKYNEDVDKGSVSAESKKILFDASKKALELGTILADFAAQGGLIPKIEGTIRAQNKNFSSVISQLSK